MHVVLDHADGDALRRVRSAISSTRAGDVLRETPAIGSSSSSTFGSRAIATASSSLRLSPCDSAAVDHGARCRHPDPVEQPPPSARVARTGGPPQRVQRAAAPRPAARSGRSAAWSGRRTARTSGRCGRCPQPGPPAHRQPGDIRAAEEDPAGRSGWRTPEIMFTSVDLPAPLGPMTASSSPGRDLQVDVVEDLAAAADPPRPMPSAHDAPARPGRRPLASITNGRRRRVRRVERLDQFRVERAVALTSLAWNIGCSRAWSSARISMAPLGPSNVQPSSAVIMPSTSSGDPWPARARPSARR